MPRAAKTPALDLPARAPGLWERKWVAAENALPPLIQQICIGKPAAWLPDEVDAVANAKNCASDIRREGDAIVADTQCQTPGGRRKTHQVMRGDFTSAYTIRTTRASSIANDPNHALRTTQEGRWLGACAPGQRPGDVVEKNSQG
jgi:hypothetical protein